MEVGAASSLPDTAANLVPDADAAAPSTAEAVVVAVSLPQAKVLEVQTAVQTASTSGGNLVSEQLITQVQIEPDSNCVREGDTVIFDINGDKQALLRVSQKGTLRMGKANCSLAPLIGAPYGSVFELGPDEKTLVRSERPDCNEWASATLTTEKNNAELQDMGNANQKLSAQDIEAMKQAGTGGAAIIDALTANSMTFQNKTEFAQEKYRKRKAKKYCLYATLVRPTARSICEAYFTKSPVRICSMRVDTLAVMLSLANVSAYARVLVVDHCSGLLMGAAAERVGGFGSVCAAYVGTELPSLDIVRSFNFSPHTKAALSGASLAELIAAQQGRTPPKVYTSRIKAANGVQSPFGNGSTVGIQDMDEDAKPAGANNTEATQSMSQQSGAEAAGALRSMHTSTKAANGTAGPHQQEPRRPSGMDPASGGVVPRTPEVQLRAVCAAGFTSCLVAAPALQPLALLRALLPLLAPSASFVVFDNHAQALAECMHALQQSKEAVTLQLQESWWREYQVLPARTHPLMNTSGTGGYVLSGTKVLQQQPPVQPDARDKEAKKARIA